MAIIPTEVAAVATIVASAFAVFLVVTILLRAQRELLVSPAGWSLIAAAIIVFAARVLGHFTEDPLVQTLRHVAGILGSVLLLSGLWLLFKASRSEVTSRGVR